jgi:hypothetical protein
MASNLPGKLFVQSLTFDKVRTISSYAIAGKAESPSSHTAPNTKLISFSRVLCSFEPIGLGSLANKVTGRVQYAVVARMFLFATISNSMPPFPAVKSCGECAI